MIPRLFYVGGPIDFFSGISWNRGTVAAIEDRVIHIKCKNGKVIKRSLRQCRGFYPKPCIEKAETILQRGEAEGDSITSAMTPVEKAG